MYRIAHWIKEKFPFIWTVTEYINSFLFVVLYGRKLSSVKGVLSQYDGVFVTREATMDNLEMILRFFRDQPQDAFKFFSPHRFDAKTISRLIKNKAYLFYIVMHENQMVGYFFLRCFFLGKCFRGKIVDYRWRNQGIAKMMGRISTDIAVRLGLRIYGAISRENVTSMASSSAVNEIKIIKDLPNNYVYIEYLPKK